MDITGEVDYIVAPTLAIAQELGKFISQAELQVFLESDGIVKHRQKYPLQVVVPDIEEIEDHDG